MQSRGHAGYGCHARPCVRLSGAVDPLPHSSPPTSPPSTRRLAHTTTLASRTHSTRHTRGIPAPRTASPAVRHPTYLLSLTHAFPASASPPHLPHVSALHSTVCRLVGTMFHLRIATWRRVAAAVLPPRLCRGLTPGSALMLPLRPSPPCCSSLFV
eukprot:3264559-Prymnesium_polylepis.1